MKTKKETRFVQTVELRTEEREDSAPVIKGYAAVFNQWADIGGWFREKIKPGAFKKTIKEADVRALWNHDPNYVLGRNKADTLTLSEDEHGLAVEISPPDSQWAKDLLVSMKRGDINQMSFGFQVVKEEWNNDTNERELLELKLFDVSVVTFPAYDQTSAAVRSMFDLDGEGTNLDAITGILFRASRGVELTDTDRTTLESHAQLIRSFLPKIEPETHSTAPEEPESHSTEAKTESLMKLRARKLNILQLY
jgi:uncharacterized protein